MNWDLQSDLGSKPDTGKMPVPWILSSESEERNNTDGNPETSSPLKDHLGGSFYLFAFAEGSGERQSVVTLMLYRAPSLHGNIWWKHSCESDPFDLNSIDKQTSQ